MYFAISLPKQITLLVDLYEVLCILPYCCLTRSRSWHTHTDCIPFSRSSLLCSALCARLALCVVRKQSRKKNKAQNTAITRDSDIGR